MRLAPTSMTTRPKATRRWEDPGSRGRSLGIGFTRLASALFSLIAMLLSFMVLVPQSTPASAHSNPPSGIPDWNASYNGTWTPNSDEGWNLPGANPPISGACGMDIGILVDRSGSIYDAGQAANMRTSAKAIVDSLAGTPSSVGVWSFGDDSSWSGTHQYPARQMTPVGGSSGPAGVAALKATIDSIPIVTGVATNWEAGFDAVHTANVTSSNIPDLLFVLTDGKPTVNMGDDSSGSVTNNADVDGGIRTANLIKADGTRVFGVGIGSGIDASTLGLIANPEQYTGANFTTAGYTLTSFSDLEATLRQLVLELCGGTVTVEKLVDEGSGTFAPEPGWEFTLAGTNATLPKSATTGIDGLATFNVDDIDPFAPTAVTLTENLSAKPGYRLLADQLVCKNSNGTDPAITQVSGGVGFSLGVADIIHCTFKNARNVVDLGIVKSDVGATGVPGGDVAYTLTYGNKGTAAAPNAVISDTVPDNAVVDLGSGPADGTNDGWVCDGAQSGVWPSGTVCSLDVGTVPAGASGLVATLTVSVVDPFPLNVAQIANTAVLNYDNSAGPDVNPQDNTSTDTTPVFTEPQISVVKTAIAADETCPGLDGETLMVRHGEQVQYCYVITNTGNTPLLNVTVLDDNATPADPADDFAVTLSGLTDEDSNGIFNDLAVGASATGQSSAFTFEPGSRQNIATAVGHSWTGQEVEASDTADVNVTPVVDLSVVKTSDPDTFTVGQTATYTLVVANDGPSDASAVVVTDKVPPGLIVQSVVDPAGWTCTTSAGTITCTVPELAAETSATIDVTVLVGADAGESVTNVAEVTGHEPDSDLTNNVSEVTNPVVAVLGISVVQPPAQTAEPPAQGAGSLPRTGRNLLGMTTAGMLLAGFGMVVVAFAQRRRYRTHA